MVNISTMSDHDLGALVRRSMESSAAQRLEVAAVDHSDAAAMIEARHEEALRFEREGRKHLFIKGFIVKGKAVVPALDAREVGLDEAVPPVLLDTYNRARAGLGMERLSEMTTFRALVSAHVTMERVASSAAVPLVAVIEEHERARSLATLMKMSEPDALIMMRRMEENA
jgi:hypothetical protein